MEHLKTVVGCTKRNEETYIHGFAFEYKLDNSELHSIFWADNVARRNYEEFSDIMSFDATYRTNRYNMMFVPFTGIDNHNKCVTFVAGLIRDEKQETYTWLLKCLMDTFKKEPTMVVTDQDKAMEIGIRSLLCRHCFSVLKNNNIEEIPAQYIMKRWTKGIIPPDLRSSRNIFDNGNVGTQRLVAKVSSVFEDCLHLLLNNDEKLEEFLKKVKSFKSEVEADMAKQALKKKN
uniref:protein FAR1-RELATED SEQUENCE 3-like n=1 Tax=Erigeron canadensis TaxID=72917 RepID=UPI001CB8E857|nr:protein FAR1-RELATED SEQUENCE 3-like [Erigeron canadensis]